MLAFPACSQSQQMGPGLLLCKTGGNDFIVHTHLQGSLLDF